MGGTTVAPRAAGGVELKWLQSITMLLWGDANILELDSGDSHTALWIY